MSDDKKLSLKEAHEKFEEECAKFKRWTELYDDEDGFDIHDKVEEDLKELRELCNTPELIARFNEENEGLTTFEEEVRRLEAQVEFNKTTDEADQIYANILKYAKMIAPHLEELGLDKEKFEVQVFNMGTFKTDIDDDKEFNEEMAEEQIYPKIEKVEAIDDEDELREYLFS